MMRPLRQRQSGIAIVTAVAVAALVAAIAGAMAFRQGLWLRQVENQHDLAQARGVARSAIDLTRNILQGDANTNKYDYPQDAWTIAIPPLMVEQGTASGRITDLQGRFNLNNLISQSTEKQGLVNGEQMDAFKRLLDALGLKQELASSLLDWIDSDAVTTSPGGAEDIEYLAEATPRRAANRPLFDVEELRLVRGFDDATIKRLTPFVSALPPGTKININFVAPEVLAALLNIDLNLAKEIVRQRDKEPLTSDAEIDQKFNGTLPEAIKASNYLTVETDYFLSEVDARFGRVTVAYRAMLFRKDQLMPKVVWMRRR